ncbi:MAG: hypothetical protein GY820_02730 [Gammaproteobacteria bacterium]|nr:hypothetical protein [Gammaproteobacteria bacterium]
MKSPHLRWVDAIHFIAGRTSLRNYLNSTGLADEIGSKGVFPYGLLKSKKSLHFNLQDIEYRDFWNELTHSNQLNEQYHDYCQRMNKPGATEPTVLKAMKLKSRPLAGKWVLMNLKREWANSSLVTLRDLLTDYSVSDVSPLRKALEITADRFAQLGICCLYQMYITLPQVSWNWLYNNSKAKDNLWLINSPELFDSMKKSIRGGRCACVPRAFTFCRVKHV